MKINNKNHTIEMTKKFAKAASHYGSKEYNDLQGARRDYPNYTVITKKAPAKRTDANKGLTYEFMEQYIQKHGVEGKTISAYEDLRGMSADAREMGRRSASYAEVKTWFFEQFPEFAAFEQKRAELLNETAA